MIAPEEMVVTVTHGGYVRHQSLPRPSAAAGAASPAPPRTRRTPVAQLFVASDARC